MRIWLEMTAALALTLTAAGCSDDASDSGGGDGGSESDPDAPETDERFVTELVGTEEMELLSDETTGLTWVNDTRACFAGVTTPGDECETLSFAEREDWRLPTTDELSELFLAIADGDAELNYIVSSCAVATGSDGWVYTENSSSPGEVSMVEPGNSGVRCVAETLE